MKKSLAAIIPLLFCCCGGLLSCSAFEGSYYHRERAEEFIRQGKLKEAIEEYKRHIQVREGEKKRPNWENPYFYYLLIGDLYLEQSNWRDALNYYERALKNKVDKKLVGDRIIRLGRWLEKRGEIEEAISLLERFVELDPDLFYIVLDRMSRVLVKKKQAELNERKNHRKGEKR